MLLRPDKYMNAQMKHTIFWLANLAGWASLLLLIGWMTAQAEVPCMPTDAAEGTLVQRYGELPVIDGDTVGPDRATTGVRIFANPKTRTWTMLFSTDGKMSCLILSGKNFRPAQPVGKPS